MAGITISVDRLQVGNYVSLPLGWREHPFLFSSFKIKSEEEIALIRRLGLQQVTLFPDKSDSPPLPPDSVAPVEIPMSEQSSQQEAMQQDKEERIARLQQYRHDVQQCDKQFQHSLSQVRSLMGKVQARPLNAITEAKELIDAITRQLLAADDLVLHLMAEGDVDDQLYYHSLNVSVLSMMRSEGRSVGKGGRSRWSPYREKKKVTHAGNTNTDCDTTQNVR